MTRKNTLRFSLAFSAAGLVLAGCAASMSQGTGMTPAELDALTEKALARSGGLFHSPTTEILKRLTELRAAIAHHYGDHYGVDVSPERVIVTVVQHANTSAAFTTFYSTKKWIVCGN